MATKSDSGRQKHSRVKKGTARKGQVMAAAILDPADKLWAFLVGAFFVLLPFVVSTSGFESFDVPKNSFLWISVGFLAVFGLVTGRLKFPAVPFLVDILLLVSLGYIVLHALVTGRLGDTGAGILSFLSIVLLYFIIRSLPFEGFHRGLWLAIAVSISLNAVFTVLQQFNMFPLMAGSGRADASDRLVPAGFIGEVNRGGFLFALVLIILLYFLFVSDFKISAKLIFVSILVAMILTGLAFSRTMTSILGLAACLAGWLVFHNWFMFRRRQSSPRKIMAFWLIILLLLAGAAALGYKAGVGDRLTRLADFQDSESWIYASSGRTPLFYLTWKMIQESPVTGRGLNSFPVEFYKYKTETETGMSVKLMPQPGAFKEVHNEYLQTWLELGIVGFLLLILLFLVPFYLGARFIIRGASDEDTYWMAVLLLGLVFAGITCLAFFPLHLAVTAPYVCLVIAQIVNLASRQADKTVKSYDIAGVLKAAWFRYGMAGVIILFAGWAVYSGIITWQVNKSTGMASYIITRAMREPLQPRQKMLIIKEAIRILEEAEKKERQLAEIKNLKGTAFLLSGRNIESAKAFQEAIRISPSPETYINLAATYLAQGADEKAAACLDKARAYDIGNMKVLQMILHMWEQETLGREQSLDIVRDLRDKGIMGYSQRRQLLREIWKRNLISDDEYASLIEGKPRGDGQ